MRYPATVLLSIVAFTAPLLWGTLAAQPVIENDDGTLYFPPKLIFSSQRARPTLTYVESRYYTTTPLLPVVFFDHPGDWAIPSRYQIFNSSSATRDYTDSNAVSGHEYSGYQRKYREILNIIGVRMQEYPETTIQLQGKFSTEPGETPDVAQARAEIVREYLITVWNLQPERIGILPPEAGCDSSDNSLRQEEARRVTILTGNWKLIRPVTYPTVFHEFGSILMQFAVDPQLPQDRVENIAIIIKGDNEIIGEAIMPGHPDSSLYRLRAQWTPYRSRSSDITHFREITIQAAVQSTDGSLRASDTEPVVLESYINERRATKQSIIPFVIPFFGWGDSSITGYHQTLIAQIIESLDASEPLVVELIGTGEYSEDPFLDEAKIQEYMTRQKSSRASGGYYNGNPYGTLSIFTPRRYDSENFIPGNPSSWDALIDESTTSSDSLSEPDRKRYTLDSLAAARARSIGQWLGDTYQETLTLMDEEMRMGRRRLTSINQLQMLPELRWYSRSVTMTMYPRWMMLKDEGNEPILSSP